MTRWQQVLIVAKWEFNRFVKWKQQLIGVALMIAIGVGCRDVVRLHGGDRGDDR